jgi:hypothetical protein
MISVPPDVWSEALATAEALPVALVSLPIAPAVAVPEDDAPKAVAARVKFATIVPGEPIVPDRRNFKCPEAPISAVTASVAAFLADVL